MNESPPNGAAGRGAKRNHLRHIYRLRAVLCTVYGYVTIMALQSSVQRTYQSQAPILLHAPHPTNGWGACFAGAIHMRRSVKVIDGYKKAPESRMIPVRRGEEDYFLASSTACAAANRAITTRYGLHET
jgi:hypothetical protein